MNKKTKVLLSICAGIVAAGAITGGLLFSQYTTQRASLLDIHDPKVVTTTIKEALMDSGAPENTEVTLDQIKEIVAKLRNLSPLYEDFIRKQKKAESNQ